LKKLYIIKNNSGYSCCCIHL